MNIIFANSSENIPTLDAYFSVDSDYPPEVIAGGQMMISLLKHLRDNVYGPDLQVGIQMFGLWFYHPNYPGSVRIEPWKQQFRFSYRIPDTWSGWDDASVVGFADDVTTATTMLFSAFQHQPNPKDWYRHLLETHGLRPQRDPQGLDQLQVRLQRVSQQDEETLYNYYAQLCSHPKKWMVYRAEAMLEFLDRMSNATSSLAYWCYTTEDASLTLIGSNTIAAGVRISPVNKIGYQVSYPLRSDRMPWPEARIEGDTRSLEEAVYMTAVALKQVHEAA